MRKAAIYWHLQRIYQKHSILAAGGPGAVGAVARRARVRAALLACPGGVASAGTTLARPDAAAAAPRVPCDYRGGGGVTTAAATA